MWTTPAFAAATKMLVQDVRDWLETLEGKGFVERARGTGGVPRLCNGQGKTGIEADRSNPESDI